MPSFLDGSNDFQRALPRPADELHHERFKPRLPEGAWVGSTMNPAWKCHTSRKVDGIPEEASVPSSFLDLRGTASVAAFVSASQASTTSNSTLSLHIHSLSCSRHSQPNSHRRVVHVAHAAYPVMPISAACWSDLSQLRHVAHTDLGLAPSLR